MSQQSTVQGSSFQGAPVTASTESVTTALQKFQASLSGPQKQEFQKGQTDALPDSNSVLIFTAKLDASAQRQTSRCVASRLQGVLESVQQYTSVVGTFVQSNPAVSSILSSVIRASSPLKTDEPRSPLWYGEACGSHYSLRATSHPSLIN